jgi:hypothetical protein
MNASAQDLVTKGAINGRVLDQTGAAVANAKITVSGQTGDRVVNANAEGEFEAPNLIPGLYTVKAEQTGFKTVSVPNVEVFVGKTSSLKLALEAGAISEVIEVSAGAAVVDTASTAVGQNLNDQLFQNIPVQRSVTSLFYLAPGVADSGKGGVANPSISGGSALDNLYVADGVNITDSAFGGLGVFSRNFGTIGVGINTAFIKEVQVKTGGFEPQYGQSQGGIINIITQSGGREFHGSLYGYARPQAFEATRNQPDDLRTNKFGKLLHEENYDAGFDLGGPVLGLKDKVFFFGSFNPTVRREIVRGAAGSGLQQTLGDTQRRYRTLNYAVKLDTNVNPNHQFAFSIFGDPTVTNNAPFVTTNIDNLTALNKLDYGTRNISTRYTGTLSPTWTVTASFSQGHNSFNESGFSNFNQIIDRTQPARGNFTAIGYGFFEPTDSTTYRATFDTSKQVSFWGQHTFGLGYQFQRAFYAGVRDRSGPKYTVPATNATGVSVTELSGAAAAAIGQQVNANWDLFSLPLDTDLEPDEVCTLCPFMNIPGVGLRRVYLRQTRGEYGNTTFDTKSNYHGAYIQDTWRINKYVTALVGLRHEQERLIGNPGADGNRIGYSFTGAWAPRLGATVDPFGKGRTKVYYNFGRFFEYIPLDLAERSLSAETDFRNGRFAPDFQMVNGVPMVNINSLGTVTPLLDAAHLLTGAAGGTGSTVSVSLSNPASPILPGTKLGYSDEHVIGFEQQLPGDFTLSVRYLDRRVKRVVEDAAVVAPESADFFGQTYFIGNITSKLDAAVNPRGTILPANFAPVFAPDPSDPTDRSLDRITNLPSGSPGCIRGLYNSAVRNNAGSVIGQICFAPFGANGQPAGNPGADGVLDGFPDAVRNYRAVEIELNKRFSKGWQLLSNWRIAKVTGNYEGHFRNDNGQTDPAISSLFDFTAGEFNLLGDQFAVGPLNTDRRHIANIYGSYALGDQVFANRLKGLSLGAGVHMESGVPVSEYLAHPVYSTPGEIPIGGRGKLGRTPFFARLDLHADYKISLTERWRFTLIGDFFNVTNNQQLRLPDMFRENTAGSPNVDFLKPGIAATDLTRGYYLPFNMRLGLRLEF